MHPASCNKQLQHSLEDISKFLSMSDFEIKREAEGYKDADIRNMPVPEFIDFIHLWVDGNCA